MTREQMLYLAQDWIAAWNRGDVDRVLADWADEARFISPRAARVTGQAEVMGKAALATYWRQAVSRFGRPQFQLDHVICDVAANEMVVIYDRLNDGGRVRAAELMRFNDDGRQIYGEALYGAELAR